MSQRVSDAELVMYGEIGYGWRHGDANHNLPLLAENIEAVVDDLRETRFEIADLRAKLAAVEQRIVGAKREGMEAAQEQLACWVGRNVAPWLRDDIRALKFALPPAPSSTTAPSAPVTRDDG